ncbi:MAG: hypothetical protein IT320_18475 [Anaerolineae bacterium]|nr:hypothetical protein [Anaerolineae bacterium]
MGRIWYRLWRVQPLTTIAVGATPSVCLHTLAMAARPSQKRLHLRDLFVGGRRYYIRLHRAGFVLQSDAVTFWNRRQRTRRSALLAGEVAAVGVVTTVRLDARLQVMHALFVLLLPTWLSALVVYAPWHPALITSIIIALYFLAIAWLRLDATLQARDMIYFVRKALEDLPEGEIGLLAQQTDDVITPLEREFQVEWDRFYEEMHDAAATDSSE